MKKVRKKPVVVEAIQVSLENLDEISAMEGMDIKFFTNDQGNYVFSVFVNTLEGIMEAFEGSYIIKGVEGEMYPCRADIFHKTYEEVTD